MSIVLALVPSLLWGALALILGAFPTDPRRQNVMVLLGAGVGSVLTAVVLGAPWSARALVWGILCGLMWTGGQVFILRAYTAWGVSLTQPLTTAVQLGINAAIGVVLFGEWRAPGAMPLGVAALVLITVGGAACSWHDGNDGPGPTPAARRRGLVATLVASVLYGSYASVLKGAHVTPEQALGPMGLGLGLGAGLVVLVLPHRERLIGPRMLPALGAGVIWCLGNALMLAATGRVGVATGFTLSQLGFVISTLGALTILREPRTRREVHVTIAGMSAAVAGLVLMGMAQS